MTSSPDIAVARPPGRSTVWVAGLTVERQVEPLSVDVPRPRLGWRLRSEMDAVAQEAYQIRVARDAQGLEDSALLWDSGRVESARSIDVAYGGPPVPARCSWQVRVWTQGGASDWSESASWEVGLRGAETWAARWVSYLDPSDQRELYEVGPAGPVILFRREFDVPAGLTAARLYITALGLYEAHLNGVRVGDIRLAPGWTDYRTRVEYQTFDVGTLLRPGSNTLGIRVADGWYAGRIASFGRGHYGDTPALLCQLELTMDDGTTCAVPTDGTWRARIGGTVTADLLAGERYEAAREPRGWGLAGYDDASWVPVVLRSHNGARLVPSTDRGVRVIADLRPTSITPAPHGKWIVDFGQNIAGVVSLDVPAASHVVLRHAEMLALDGSLETDNLVGAEQRDEIITAPEGGMTFEPAFTVHGFRFVEVAGYPGRLPSDAIRARALSSAARTIGAFTCSDQRVNRLQQNIQWTLRDNFVSIPTDCPQRDERLGWLGDIGVFASTALFNADVGPVLARWLEDVIAAQAPSGAFPDVAPQVGVLASGNAGWADAGIEIPWQLHMHTGDREILERCYPAMRRYLAFLAADHTEGLRHAGRYGDWLGLPPRTSKLLVGTASLAHTARRFGVIADTLGHPADARRARALRRLSRNAFITRFMDQAGRMSTETQTGYALAVGQVGLPRRLARPAADRLASLIEGNGLHLSTGFIGTSVALHALSDNGHHDLACRIVGEETRPSWLYAVDQGATTLWERWDGGPPGVGQVEADSNSLNHFAFGSVGTWLYEYIAGLQPFAPGYRRTRFAPRPGPGFRGASAHHKSPYGEHGISWQAAGGRLDMEIEIPANTHADVVIPPGRIGRMTLDGRAWTPPGGSSRDTPTGTRSLVVGSGHHRIELEWEP